MRHKFVPISVLLIVVMVATNGCSRRPAVPATPEPALETLPENRPVVPSKGRGMKKRIPVAVRTGDRLGWVDNALQAYPPDRFFTGLGIAPDRKTAEKRSWTELKKPFVLTIDGRLTMRIEAMGTLAQSSFQEFGKFAVTSRESAIESVFSRGRVAEIFSEAAPAQTIYALAVMDRHICADQLMRLIRPLDDQLKAITARLEKAEHPVAKVDQVVLVETFFRREALDAVLAMVSPAGKGVSLPVPPNRIGRLLRKK